MDSLNPAQYFLASLRFFNCIVRMQSKLYPLGPSPNGAALRQPTATPWENLFLVPATPPANRYQTQTRPYFVTYSLPDEVSRSR